MKTIKSSCGEICNLSDEVYVVINDNGTGRNYTGRLVRLISGIDNSGIIGYHFSAGFRTVHLIGCSTATFIGFPTKNLVRIDDHVLTQICEDMK